MDGLAAKEVTFAALLNHNLTSGATITLRAWHDLGLFQLFAVGDLARQRHLLSAALAAELPILDVGPFRRVESFLLPCRRRSLAGVIDKLTTFNFIFGHEDTDQVANAEVLTGWGVRQTERRFKRKEFDNLTFTNMTYAQKETLRALLNALDGSMIPVFVIPDPAIYDGWYMNLRTPFRSRPTSHAYFDACPISLRGRSPRPCSLLTMIKKLVLIIALLACGAIPAFSSTYYVAKAVDGGSNGNNCTAALNQSTPKLSIMDGIDDCLAPGDTLVIGAGTYNEFIAWNSPGFPGAQARSRLAQQQTRLRFARPFLAQSSCVRRQGIRTTITC